MPRQKKEPLIRRGKLKWKTIKINSPLTGKSSEAMMYPFSGAKLWVRQEDKAPTWQWEFVGNRHNSPYELPDDLFRNVVEQGFENVTAAKTAALAWFLETFAVIIDE